ncbi:MAG: hypothetical protein E7364_04150 [Clostridiales bacterium]|nr:hypothetical protein [Clostridiales bacterium]
MKKIKKRALFLCSIGLSLMICGGYLLGTQQDILSVKAEEVKVYSENEELEEDTSISKQSMSSDNLVEGSQFNDVLGRLSFDGMVFRSDIEDYDYFELIKYSELQTLKDWLISLNFDFDNTNDVLWIEQNFNKIVEKSMDLGVLRNIFRPVRTRWGGPTHPVMMTKVFDLLRTSQFTSVTNYYENLSVTYEYDGDDMTGNAINALAVWALQPDLDESITGTHYYIPYDNTASKTGAYYVNRNENYSRSARTRMEDHYSSAVNAYWNNDIDNAIKYLGFSIHYLMDTGNTAHVTGVSGEPHSAYEDYIDSVIGDASFHSTSSSIGTLFGVFENSFQPINNLAHNACNGTVNNGVSFRDAIASTRTGTNATIYYEPIIKATLPLTEQYVAALLEQFCRDTIVAEDEPTHRSKKAIINNHIYCLKNLETGYYADVKGWGTSSGTKVQQFSFTGDTNQMFRAKYNQEDASFGFEPLHAGGKRMSFDANALGYDIYASIRNASTTSSFQRFKPTYLENGYYRVMTGVSEKDHKPLASSREPQYAEVLRVSPNDPNDNSMYDLRQELSHYEYNPDSYNHYWVFEEVVSLSNSTTLHQRDFEENKIYQISTTSSLYGNRTFSATNSSTNYFEVGYRTGSGTANYTRVFESASSSANCTVYLNPNRIYYIKVTNKKVQQYNQTFNIGDVHSPAFNMGSSQYINIRFFVNEKQSFEVESSYPIEFFTSAGAILPMNKRVEDISGKYRYTVNFNANTDYNAHETYFIKVRGTLVSNNYITDVQFKRIAFTY